ncbi:hypothetical protein PPROV_000523300 [Pycnococcus provasolii]|uniref:Uncharacterized protein n=1 Tax=Pycnococcus provasolii TaxID=41880 RepID=A0A830HHZ4_9CHLO|nr:hypothetical protein PPROV_000523300 [Pycnococcus provasolii]
MLTNFVVVFIPRFIYLLHSRIHPVRISHRNRNRLHSDDERIILTISLATDSCCCFLPHTGSANMSSKTGFVASADERAPPGDRCTSLIQRSIVTPMCHAAFTLLPPGSPSAAGGGGETMINFWK